ncbi:MAG: diaminopimelate epimerase [Gemmatimonadaceae bacterium]
MVEHQEKDLTVKGRKFYKMSGSGNDFVFFDLRDGPAGSLETPEAVRAISARATGVGADGVVFLEPGTRDSFSIRYYNSDGSLGELCGNATLCSLRLAHETGLAEAGEVSIGTDSGVVAARMVAGLPEIDLAPVTEVEPRLAQVPMLDRESELGFARAGVPHVVILDKDVASADVLGRGSSIRRNPVLRQGANVNFLSKAGPEWSIRTYERGVEGETLACGTGAVASGILLVEWGQAESPLKLRTRSGRLLEVRLRRVADAWFPSLRGSADLVFTGQLEDVPA